MHNTNLLSYLHSWHCFWIPWISHRSCTGILSFSVYAALPSATRACGGCSIAEHHFQFDWYSEVFTHTAATIVKIVNNSTNVTRTSTIRASSFVIPSQARYAAIPVSELVVTTDIGGVDYTLYAIPFKCSRWSYNFFFIEHIQPSITASAGKPAIPGLLQPTALAVSVAWHQLFILPGLSFSVSMLLSMTCTPPSRHEAAI